MRRATNCAHHRVTNYTQPFVLLWRPERHAAAAAERSRRPRLSGGTAGGRAGQMDTDKCL